MRGLWNVIEPTLEQYEGPQDMILMILVYFGTPFEDHFWLILGIILKVFLGWLLHGVFGGFVVFREPS